MLFCKDMISELIRIHRNVMQYNEILKGVLSQSDLELGPENATNT